MRKQIFYAKDFQPVERYLNIVIKHLTQIDTYKITLTKFRYLGLKAAVKALLDRGVNDTQDFAVFFETLRDHDSIDAWLEELEEQGSIPKTSQYHYSTEEIREAELNQTKEDADRLGHVLLSKADYKRLKATETRYWQLVKSHDCWPASLC